MSDFSPTFKGGGKTNGDRKVVAYYLYPGENGDSDLRKVRYEPKSFGWQTCTRIEIKHVENGKTVPTGEVRESWKSGGSPRVLYRKDELDSGKQDGIDIWLVDGEKDVDRAFEEGETATCGPHGCSTWHDWMSEQLSGAMVRILADNDPDGTGLREAAKIRMKLRAAGVSVIGVFKCPVNKDLSDHFDNGLSWDDIVEVPDTELRSALVGERFEIATSRVPTAGPTEAREIFDTVARELGNDIEKANPRDIAKVLFGAVAGVCYLPVAGQYLRWNGNYYTDCEADLRTQFIPATVESARAALIAEAKKEQAATKGKASGKASALRQREYSFSRGSFPRELMGLLADAAYMPDELFDCDSGVLACESGVLDRQEAKPLVAGVYGDIKWLPHDPARLITKCIPFKHDPNARAPEWIAFLKDSIHDPGERMRFQTLIGFALAGDNTKKKQIVNLIGPPDSGKSTALDTLGQILGPYLGTMRTEEVLITRYSSKFDFHGLKDCRAVFIAEPDPNSRFRTGELKRITGGEEVTTEAKGKQSVVWRASVMPFIGTNYTIVFDSTDDAFTGRLEYIRFERTRAIDRELKAKLREELSGIFNWVLQGVLSYFADGLSETEEAGKRSREIAAADVESPLQFIAWAIEEGHIVEVDGDFPAYKCCHVTPLFERYVEWFEGEYGRHGQKPYGRKRFSSVVDKVYPRPTKAAGGGNIVFSGIAPVRRVRSKLSHKGAPLKMS